MRKILSGHPIGKLYLSNFLTGLIFWYGIEKLFMQHIGINAFGLGVAEAVYVTLMLLLDIPFGLLADYWSRKGVLAISTCSLALSSFILGTSGGLGQYVAGYIFYAVYIVSTSGTYQAIIYDVLHERNQSEDYSRIMGRAYGLFMVGAGIANIASGFIAQMGGLVLPFLLSIIPCAINFLLVLTIREPVFHKEGAEKKLIRGVAGSLKLIAAVALLRSLTLIWIVQGVVDLFKLEFSQLYMLQFTKSAIILGLLWALYAFAMAVGSAMAHRVRARLGPVLVLTLLLIIGFGLTTNAWGLVLFMAHAVTSGVVNNLIETQVQHTTPSAVRASVMSVMSTAARVASLPASLVFGWIISAYGVFWALRLLAFLGILTLAYWALVGSRRLAYKNSAPTSP